MNQCLLIIFLFLPFAATTQLFVDASSQLPDIGANGQSMDVKSADIDGDSDMDIVLANEFQINTVLLNDGKGIFSNVGSVGFSQVARDSEDVAISDFDQDGNMDLVFCSEDDVVLGRKNVHEYYIGDGNGGFNLSSYQLPDSESNAVISVDINADGFDDLVFGNNGINSMLINTGTGSFDSPINAMPQINRVTQDLAISDIDGDGDFDIFEGNENGNVLLRNDGSENFTDVSQEQLPQGLNIETRKVTFGDVDGDGDEDVFLSNVAFVPGKNLQNRLYLNDGTGVFRDVTYSRLPVDSDFTLDAVFDDLDLDGDLDIIVCNFGGAPIKVYENDGRGVFNDNTEAVLGQLYVRDALGVVLEDFNGDGLKDIYVCDRNNPVVNNKDLLLLRKAVVTSQNEAEPSKGDLIVSPNPSHDFFVISMSDEKPNLILITDINGGLIKKFNNTSRDTINLDLSNYPNGTYCIIARYKDKSQIVKRVIQE